MSETEFKNQTLARTFHVVVNKNNKNDKFRITKNTIQMMNEYLKIFTVEAILRANQHRESHSENGDEPVLDVEDLEAILGMLVLDF